MSDRTGQASSFRTSGARFAVTRWSVVLAAGGDRAVTGTRRALEELIQAYWFPLYAFVRRQGESPAAAEDMVQEFFARLLEKRFLAQADRSKGRFRTFLLTAVKHFLANEWDKARARKRGGGVHVIALDALAAEARYALEPADHMTPDRLFDRRWALAVLDHVLARLRQEYLDSGKTALYESVKDCLIPATSALSYTQIASRLGATEGAVKVAVHRMRRRYRDLLKDEIAQTVDSAEEIDEEIAYLLSCL